MCMCVSIYSYKVMLECWQFNPVDRPTFKQLADTFDSFLASSVVSELNVQYLLLIGSQM